MIKNLLLLIIFTCLLFGCSDPKPVIQAPEVVEKGLVVPDFDYEKFYTDKLDKRNFHASLGQVIYLDFWASWCKPCLKSMPELNTLYNELSDNGFTVIAVNLDMQAEMGLKFLNEHPVDYPVIRAEYADVMQRFNIKGLPTSFLIDSKGVVQFIHQGFKDDDIKLIREEVNKYLNPGDN